MIQSKRLVGLALVAAVLISLVPLGDTRAQEEDAVALLMAEMSSAAKVGQLFLVAFPGAEVGDDALITEMIRDYHIGGVVLLPENGNIVNEGDTPVQVATLVGQLQETALVATQPTTDTVEAPGPFIPLFIAVNHEGNGMPFTGIVSGTTSLPSEMALGAAWNPAHAEAVGQVVGQELHALGINMLLGPSLDVLETPRPGSTGDLGVRAFGGEPFWVGRMGQAYIRGVHQGAGGQIAVVAKHFPGLGTSDRSLDEEISTVQRTLEKLRQVDLAPFFAVAQAEDTAARPDGVLVSHIRFRGLEGGRYATSRPVSVDSQVLQRLLSLPELAAWRQGGGVTVSDELGVRALRRFYDPGEVTFNGRRIAQEAFFAGNDLLFLSEFALSDDWETQIANVTSTITFFRDKYDNDPSFQASVDAAVRRILRLKLSLYGDTFRISAVRPYAARVGEQMGLGREALSPIGRDAITLLSPPSSDLVPSPPTSTDDIVIFTDSRSGLPCATCAPVPYIGPTALQDTIIRLYGPNATGQVTPWRVSSFTFDQLQEYLNTPSVAPTPVPGEEQEPTPTPNPAQLIGSALQNAEWIVFAMLDSAGDSSSPGVIRRFLAEQADALGTRHLVVLAYDAPYYLDATEISKLSAYYAAYSRIEPFIEASVRTWFGEFAPVGAPPVSVTGVNYDLLLQTSPDPNQTIALFYSVKERPEEDLPTLEPTEPVQSTPEPTGEAQPTTEPRPVAGDQLELRTGVILDHQGHSVPDGTPVYFIFTYPQEGLEQPILVTTRGGVAETVVTLDRPGQLDVSIQADPVPRQIALQITIQEGEPVVIWTPTPIPSPTPFPTPEPTTEPAPPPEATLQPTPEPGYGDLEGRPTPEEAGFLDLALALIAVLFVGSTGYYVVRAGRGPTVRALRLALWCVIGGLALYLAYVLRLPGAAWLREQSGTWAAGWATLFGGMVPLVIAWIVAQGRKAGLGGG